MCRHERATSGVGSAHEATAPTLQRVHHVDSRGPGRRPQPEGDAAGQDDAEGEEGDAPVETQVEVEGNREGGQERVESGPGRMREHGSHDAPEREEDEGLGQEGTGQIGPRRAERSAHRQLAPAEHSPREHETRYVHESDEQHERSHPSEDAQKAQDGSTQVRVEARIGAQSDAQTAMAVGVLAGQLGREAGHLDLGRAETGRPAESTHELQAAIGAIREADLGGQGGRRRQGEIDVEGEADEMAAELVFGHAHEGEGPAVDAQGPAEHIGPAPEAPLPQGLADDRRRFSPAHVVRGVEQAAEAGARAEQGEESAGHELAADDGGGGGRSRGRLLAEDEPVPHERLDPQPAIGCAP